MAAPTRPLRLPRAAIVAAIRRAPERFQREGMTDVAAALTYFAVFSIFPALIALVSILGFVGDSATGPLLDSLRASPGQVGDLLTGVVTTAAEGGGGRAFVLGLGIALWSASGYVGAFGRASNRIFGVREGRPFWKLRPGQLALTAALLVLVALAATASVVSGPIARELGDIAGLGAQTARTWDRLKIPGILVVSWIVITLLMSVTPNVRLPSIRWVMPGSLVALLAWVAASSLLGIYFAEWASYDRTYGALAGVIAFLFWLWVSNVILLFGQTINAELEWERQKLAGETARDGSLAPTPKQTPAHRPGG